MAKPINLYQGQAPSVFSQMGDPSISKGMTDAAKSLYGGISEGVTDAATAYAKSYQQSQEDNSTVQSLKDMSSMIEDEGTRNSLQRYLEDSKVSNRTKAKFGTDYLNEAIRYKYLMDIEKERNKGRLDLQGMKGQGGTAPVRFDQYDLKGEYPDESYNKPNFYIPNAGGLDLRTPTYRGGMPS